ncbi:helix-turn-helix domain-containing protein [Longimicrobium sp.]|jgi:DNA-binding CsgD family transcriptional regulator|uniref:helix-turn-helix domain-containing protein n=1 Tax=Longimicrobium sp. TaxID=2029185 RepID=UPI002EDA94E5
MSITLSSADVAKLTRAIQLLVSPLDFESVDNWRSAVNRGLGDLLCADSAGFLLPVNDGLAMYSDQHDPKSLSAFPELEPPRLADGRTVWEEGIRCGVTSLEMLYGPGYELFRTSAYYNEYAAPNGAHDTIGATVPLTGLGSDANAVASLHFWHARPVGRLFGERELALLRLLFPAFRAGVETQVRWDRWRIDLLRSLDTLGQAVMVFDSTGRPIHQTPALTGMLADDPESTVLNLELQVVMNSLRSAMRIRGYTDGPLGACASVIHTGKARYAIRGSLYGGPPSGSIAYMLVSLERRSPIRRPDAELQAVFGLTRAEIRVAAFLAEGKPNVEIARALGVTAHTARRHTERVLQKMGIHSRAQVAVWMYS